MILNKVLVDTNICLDAALYRSPFAVHAYEIIERSEKNEFSGMVAGHSLDTMFYLLRKRKNKNETYELLKDYRRAFGVCAVTQSVIDDALDSNWNDFEDAIQYYSAKECGCDAVVTRNTTDFTASDLPVFSPGEFLAQFKNENL